MALTRFRWLLAIFALIAFPCAMAFPFGTDFHGDMTREVLAKTGMDRAGVKLIVDGNENTDKNPELYNTLHAHFCNEEFARGSERLRSKMLEALDALAHCDRARALDAMGTSLHAIQDFYAHSNAINVYPDSKITVDLFHLQDPGPGVVCSPGHLPSSLTSAYWPDDGHFPGKCTHEQIAKDEPEVGPEYGIARARATLATAQYFEIMERMIRWGIKDSVQKIRFLNQGSNPKVACQPSPKSALTKQDWLAHLNSVIKAMPSIVLPPPPVPAAQGPDSPEAPPAQGMSAE